MIQWERAMPERPTMQRTGALNYVLSTWTGEQHPGEKVQSHAQWFSVCLYNETLTETLNLGELPWLLMLSMYCHTYMCWEVDVYWPYRWWKMAASHLEPSQTFALRISPFCWFGLVSFCYTKTLVVSITIFWILEVVLVNLNLRGHRNPEVVAS